MESSPSNQNYFEANSSERSEDCLSSLESKNMSEEGSSKVSHHVNISTLSGNIQAPYLTVNGQEYLQRACKHPVQSKSAHVRDFTYRQSISRSQIKDSICSINTEVKQMTDKLEHIKRVLLFKEQENAEMKTIILGLENKVKKAEKDRRALSCGKCQIF